MLRCFQRAGWFGSSTTAATSYFGASSAQQKERNLLIEDGWIYFIHGWTRVIAEVFHIDIPVKGPEFAELSRIAATVR